MRPCLRRLIPNFRTNGRGPALESLATTSGLAASLPIRLTSNYALRPLGWRSPYSVRNAATRGCAIGCPHPYRRCGFVQRSRICLDLEIRRDLIKLSCACCGAMQSTNAAQLRVNSLCMPLQARRDCNMALAVPIWVKFVFGKGVACPLGSFLSRSDIMKQHAIDERWVPAASSSRATRRAKRALVKGIKGFQSPGCRVSRK